MLKERKRKSRLSDCNNVDFNLKFLISLWSIKSYYISRVCVIVRMSNDKTLITRRWDHESNWYSLVIQIWPLVQDLAKYCTLVSVCLAYSCHSFSSLLTSDWTIPIVMILVCLHYKPVSIIQVSNIICEGATSSYYWALVAIKSS